MADKNKTMLWTLIGLVALFLIGYTIYASTRNTGAPQTTLVTNFEECASAGFPISTTYPRECSTPDGDVYQESLPDTDQGESTAVAKAGCFISGCNQEICSEEADIASTCEYKPEFACYRSGICEKQGTGRCGWTETPELLSCLEQKGGNFGK